MACSSCIHLGQFRKLNFRILSDDQQSIFSRLLSSDVHFLRHKALSSHFSCVHERQKVYSGGFENEDELERENFSTLSKATSAVILITRTRKILSCCPSCSLHFLCTTQQHCNSINATECF